MVKYNKKTRREVKEEDKYNYSLIYFGQGNVEDLKSEFYSTLTVINDQS